MKLDREMSKVLVRLFPSMAKYMDDKGEITVLLNKAIYGIVEAALLWYRDVRAALEGHGYVVNPADVCVFNYVDTYGRQCTALVHVDDLLVTASSDETLDTVLRMLKHHYGEVTVMRGDRHEYLGAMWDFTQEGEVNVSMDRYVDTLLQESGVDGTATTPAKDELFERVGEDGGQVDPPTREWFHSLVARLLYLAKILRRECLTAVAYLSTRVTCATRGDVEKLRRLVRYLRPTRTLGLRLRVGERGVCVTAAADAAYAVHSDRKSHTGGALMVGGGSCVLAKSAKQRIVTKSSTEAELVAASDFVNCAYGLQKFLRGQGYAVPPIRVLQDNTSTIALLAKGRPTSDRSRHIDVRYFWLSEREKLGEVVIDHLRTDRMGAANCLTKPLQGDQFVRERSELQGMSKAL